MAKFLYGIFIKLYPLIINLVVPFNPKAKLWIEGRKNIFQHLEKVIKPTDNIIWMHCSSLGEFEQGRPILETLRSNFTNNQNKILLTFFSPSGYETMKNYKDADFIFYLPIDSSFNAIQFYDIVNPKLVLFVKYEFWYYYLTEGKKRNIPLLLISGIFRKRQPFFKWYGNMHGEMLKCFKHLFVQNKASAELLASIQLQNVTIAGDTRFDRVIEIAEKFEPIPLIEQFCKDTDVLVAGSTWTDDDKVLDHFANTNPHIKFIIAPHNIGSQRINECRKFYKNAITFSEVGDGIIPDTINTLIIDSIGILSRLYKYATVCYVGGAFGGDGVHNVLEAAVYGKPVVFGPEYDKYFEAEELINNHGAVSIENALELETELNILLKKDGHYLNTCTNAKNYVYSKKGATQLILNYIYENRLLTN